MKKKLGESLMDFELINELRCALNLTENDVTDSELLIMTERTLLRERIEVRMALLEFKNMVIDETKNLKDEIKRRMINGV